jgi:hypothetical protein
MNINTINEYRQWVERGLLDKKPINCSKCDILLVPMIIPMGIKLTCPLCLYNKDLGYGEYLRLMKLNQAAQLVFDMRT